MNPPNATTFRRADGSQHTDTKVRNFKATDAEFAPVLAYAKARGCSVSVVLRALIATLPPG